jgi:peroxiredoxin Q/BCP
LLEQGAKLPDVTVADDTGATIRTTDLLGKTLVVYFYPKDDTPGCTSEANQFSDDYAKYEKAGAHIVGVSRDSAESHRAFKEKYGIPYRLLADVDQKVCEAFGVLVERNTDGKISYGVQRATFLFDAGGTLTHVWPKVTVEGHSADVLATIG